MTTTTEQTDIEALAEALCDNDADPATGNSHIYAEHSERAKEIWRGYARRVAASDWLARHDREVAERAWDEGEESLWFRLEAAWREGCNPARADAIQEGRA